MKPMIAYCGLLCDTCPIHLAALEKDPVRQKLMRESLVEEYKKHYGVTMKAEDFNDCDGCCANTGKIYKWCSKCEIRNCVQQKNLKSCAYCDDYVCDRLTKIFNYEHGAKERLDELKATLR